MLQILPVAVVWATLSTVASAQSILSAPQAMEKISSGSLVLIDIRTPQEWKQSGIPEPAIPLSLQDRQFIPKLNRIRSENPNKEIAIICAVGGRTAFVQREMTRRKLGTVIDVSEGMMGNKRGQGWIKRGLPLRKWP